MRWRNSSTSAAVEFVDRTSPREALHLTAETGKAEPVVLLLQLGGKIKARTHIRYGSDAMPGRMAGAVVDEGGTRIPFEC